MPLGRTPAIRVSGVIQVVEYDPAWPQRFDEPRREYVDAAAAGVRVVAVEHVGSTCYTE